MFAYITVGLLCVSVISVTHASFESSDAASTSAQAAGSGLLKSIWDSFGNNLGSVNNGLGSVGSGDYLGSTGSRQDGNYAPRTNYPSSPREYPPAGTRDYYPAAPRDTYPASPRNDDGYPDYNNGRAGQQQDYNRRPAATQPLPAPARQAATGNRAVSTERSGRNRFPDPTRIYDNAERETMVLLRVAPVLSQSTRNTPYEVVEAIFHGPWSWEWAAQHVYALHWDLEYRFDAFGDTVFTFGSRKENDGKLWGSLDKRAFTEMPAKYFFLGNITTSPKAATQAAYDNPLNGQVYDVMSVNCQTWAIQHCKDMSDVLYQRMKNFPTLLESAKYAVLWAQSAIASVFDGTDELKAPPPPVRDDPNQLW